MKKIWTFVLAFLGIINCSEPSMSRFTRADSFLQTSVNVCFFQVCELPVVYGVFN